MAITKLTSVQTDFVTALSAALHAILHRLTQNCVSAYASTPVYVGLQLPSPFTLTSVQMDSYNMGESGATVPAAFTVYGSPDGGATWVNLAAFSGAHALESSCVATIPSNCEWHVQ
jgi:hypothetical protein